MLCVQCKEKVLAANKSWGFHHQVKTLHESALAGCFICTQLVDDIRKARLELDSESTTHRWTIRTKTHTREQAKEWITITFRAFSTPVPLALPTRIFYLIDEKELCNTPNPNAMSNDTASSLEQLDRWISECHTNHPRCQRARDLRLSEPTFIPTRLIEIIGPNPESGRLRLVETKDWLPGTPLKPYMTLSHCWGELKMFCTYPENKAKFLDNIDLKQMPKTFRHVMRLAWRLGISYVWIDSICVIQGDKGDFGSEAHHMHSVYRHSYLNVAAAASTNGEGGLYQNRLPHQIVSSPFNLPNSEFLGRKFWLVFPSDIWKHQLLQETLYTRGWVFQERMLSPRIVHFGSKQVFWDCATKSACEVFPNRIPEPLDTISATERHWRERLQLASIIRNGRDLVGEADGSVETLWRTAIANYTACSLKWSTDKLIACWSIAKLVRDMLEGEQYAVGMWSFNLHKQLSWRVLDYTKSRRIFEVKGAKVPSWTWASIHEKLKLQGCPLVLPQRLGNPEDDNAYTITGHGGLPLAFLLKEEKDVFKAENEEPVLEDLKLAIRGHVFVAHLRPIQGVYTMDLFDGSSNRDKIAVHPDLQPAAADDDGLVTFCVSKGNVMYSGKDFGLVTDATHENGVHTGSGLILECTVLNPQPVFRRTGVFTFQGLHEQDWDHVTTTNESFTKTLGGEIYQQGLELWLT